MKIVDKEPYETPPNIVYGVDVNNKEAVNKELKRLKYRRFLWNIITILALIVLGCFAFDFARVSFFDEDPIFYKKERVDGGYLYKGLGYGRLHCDDGNEYVYLNKQNKCISSAKTFDEVFYNKFKEYAIEKEIIDIEKIQDLVLSNITNDGSNEYGGTDYVVDVSYLCVDTKNECFKKLKVQEEYGNFKLFVSFNNYNEVVNITAFKNYGTYYDSLIEDYTNKLKEYMISNQMYVEDNVKYFDIELLSNYGRIKFQDVYYNDSYKVKISYTCKDNGSDCVNKEGFTYDNFLYFNVAMLLDKDNNIVLLKNEAILDL